MFRLLLKASIRASISFALVVILYGVTIFSSNAYAASPQYVKCSSTSWVTQGQTPFENNDPGVTGTSILRFLMDARYPTIYCFEAVANISVTTSHTGQLQETLASLLGHRYDRTTCRVNGGSPPCSKSGSTSTVYGNPASVSDGVNVCAQGVFYDDNGLTPQSGYCADTP